MDGPLDDSAAFLRAARKALSGLGSVALEEVRVRGWKSANFRGARHEFLLRFRGLDCASRADRFVEALARTELDLPGHVVADVDLVAEERRAEWTLLRMEVLTVEA
jgi:hypothetical protein